MKYIVDAVVTVEVEAPDEADVPEVVGDYLGECEFGDLSIKDYEIIDISAGS